MIKVIKQYKYSSTTYKAVEIEVNVETLGMEDIGLKNPTPFHST